MLERVLETLVWSMFLTSIIVFAVILIRWLPQGVRGGRGKDVFDKELVWERIRVLIITMPLLYIFLNFSTDANTIADILFNRWMPLVLGMVFALGVWELAVPYVIELVRTIKKLMGQKKR